MVAGERGVPDSAGKSGAIVPIGATPGFSS
jgi:hypothetical protein